jgi:hypothetical protein
MNSRQIAAGIHGNSKTKLEGLKLDQRELKNLRWTVALEVHGLGAQTGEQLVFLEFQQIIFLRVILDVGHPERHATRDADITFLLEPKTGVAALRVIEHLENVRHVRPDEFGSLTPGDLSRVAQAGRLAERVLTLDFGADQGHVTTRIGKDGVMQFPSARGEDKVALQESGLVVQHQRFAFLTAPFAKQIAVVETVLLRENLEGCGARNDADGCDEEFFHDGLLVWATLWAVQAHLEACISRSNECLVAARIERYRGAGCKMLIKLPYKSLIANCRPQGTFSGSLMILTPLALNSA